MGNEAVLLVLCRKVIAGLLIESISKNQNMRVYGVYKHNEVRSAAMTYKPQLALIEVADRYGDPVPAEDALDVCLDIRESSPDCKIMLLCPERDKESVNMCVDAKKRGEIQDFLFYEASVEYLVSKLEAL